MTRILIIEDEAMVRENLSEIVQAEGYEVITAAEGEEGIRLARSVQPDLILCDIRMPRLDGFGVLAMLSHDRLTDTIPFIFITAHTEKADQRLGMGLGADDYITKPFTRRDLLNSIRKRLEKQQVLLRQAEAKYNQLQGSIAHRLPASLLSPLSVLLSNAELLEESDSIAADPVQVRGIAKGMRRAAASLTHFVRSYMLYLELDAVPSNPDQQSRLLAERVTVRGDEIAMLLQGVTREWGREEDLHVDMDAGVLKMSEPVFFTLLEELADLAIRRSRSGNAVNIRGQIHNAYYDLSVSSQVGQDFAALLLVSSEDPPLGYLLARRIAEIYGGGLEIQDTDEGVNRVTVRIPRL
jgi:two-component system, sensor histidine kinase and response regulator